MLADPRWGVARSVAAFVGVGGEPDTGSLLQAALDYGKELWLPRVVRGQPMLSFVRVGDLATLAPAAFALLEPVPRDGEQTLRDLSCLDLALVPGVGFSWAGERLGFGRGYYDRALAGCAGDPPPVRMGLCFAAFVTTPGGIPTAPHDVPMHALATEDGIVEVG